MLTRSLFGLRHGLLFTLVLGMTIGMLATLAVVIVAVESLH